jgi:hypothetical protein
MAGEVLVDALPYIDSGYDDSGVRETVSNANIQQMLIDLCLSNLTNSGSPIGLTYLQYISLCRLWP